MTRCVACASLTSTKRRRTRVGRRRGSLLNSTRAELDDRLERERIGLFLQNGIKYCGVRVQLPRGICDLAFERLTHAASQIEFDQLAWIEFSKDSILPNGHAVGDVDPELFLIAPMRAFE